MSNILKGNILGISTQNLFIGAVLLGSIYLYTKGIVHLDKKLDPTIINDDGKRMRFAGYSQAFDTTTTVDPLVPTAAEIAAAKDKILKNILAYAGSITTVVGAIEAIKTEIEKYDATIVTVLTQQKLGNITATQVTAYLTELMKTVTTALNITLNTPAADYKTQYEEYTKKYNDYMKEMYDHYYENFFPQNQQYFPNQDYYLYPQTQYQQYSPYQQQYQQYPYQNTNPQQQQVNYYNQSYGGQGYGNYGMGYPYQQYQQPQYGYSYNPYQQYGGFGGGFGYGYNGGGGYY